MIAAMYAAYHGPDGLTAIAARVHGKAAALAADAARAAASDVPAAGVLRHRPVRLPGGAASAAGRAREAGYNLYLADARHGQVACDETTTDAHLAERAAALTGARAARLAARCPSGGGLATDDDCPRNCARSSGYLTHPVFHEYRSETAMLRYLRRLADFDIALDRSMIPLGSCTMKLNAAAEMEPITWPEFANLHPFAPAEQTEGYLELIARPGGCAGRDHRVRRGLAAAERGLPG